MARVEHAVCVVDSKSPEMPSRLNIFSSRQNPMRMPYSCHDQLGRSGSNGTPIGGGFGVRDSGASHRASAASR